MSGSTVVAYLDPISPYAHLALERISSSESAEIDWLVRPVVYAKLLEAHGLIGPVETEAKRRYTMLDLVRSAEREGLEVVGPPTHPFRSLSALRVMALYAETECARVLALTLSRAAWAEGRDLEDWSVLEDCVRAVGLEASDLGARATTEENKQRLIASTTAAFERGVFGVPSFDFDGELFWGHDRLDALFERVQGVRPHPDPARVDSILAHPIGVRRPPKR